MALASFGCPTAILQPSSSTSDVPMHHAPAGDEGCLFLILFDGPFDVEPVDR